MESFTVELNFCNHIRKYRERLHLTQSQLAAKVGLSKNAISSFERGEYCPSAFSAFMLCLALGCSFEELFFID